MRLNQLSFALFIGVLLLSISMSSAEDKVISSAGEIQAAFSSAKAGDTIIIKPGTYSVNNVLGDLQGGTKEAPLTIRCEGDKGYAVLNGSMQQVGAGYMTFIGIHFNGGNKDAAVKISGESGKAVNLKFIDCKFSDAKDFALKTSRNAEAKTLADNLLLENCEFYNSGYNAVDIVGGDNIIVRNCYVHNYGRSHNSVNYGIFQKGGGKNGIIEGCIVDGAGGKDTVGISFGGGTTGAQYMKPGNKIEHSNGIARNNIVMNSGEVAYHSNRAKNCSFYNNLSFNCAKIQAQDPKGSIKSVNDAIGKQQIGGVKMKSSFPAGKSSWFKDPKNLDFRLTKEGESALSKGAAKVKDNPTDLYGTNRSGKNCGGPVLPGSGDGPSWVDRRK